MEKCLLELDLLYSQEGQCNTPVVGAAHCYFNVLGGDKLHSMCTNFVVHIFKDASQYKNDTVTSRKPRSAEEKHRVLGNNAANDLLQCWY